jgi:hypothetical protein
MAILVRKLSSGESIVFDKDSRELFILAKGHSGTSLDEARKLHSQGKAMRFDKSQLATLNSALSAVVLLGA